MQALGWFKRGKGITTCIVCVDPVEIHSDWERGYGRMRADGRKRWILYTSRAHARGETVGKGFGGGGDGGGDGYP